MRRLALLCAGAFGVVLAALPAAAHESLPVYLEVNQATSSDFEVMWRIPATQGAPPALSPSFPVQCRAARPPVLLPRPGALVGRWTIHCAPPGLARGRITVAGLERTVLDALVRIKFADGREVTRVLRPSAPTLPLSDRRRSIDVSGYFRLGVEHILFGIDHLLFVAGLVLIVGGARRLAKTVTAFTVAHSITLALATLGFVHVPSAPVEATIALSIVFLARELVRAERGEIGLTARYPWIVAFTFGLLHGFGFAGGLAALGLPQHDIPLALFLFNVGVETGQLAFVAALLALRWGVARLHHAVPAALTQLPTYAIGAAAAFWLIQRLAALG